MLGHLLGLHGDEHLEDRGHLVIGVLDDVVGFQRGGEDGEAVDSAQAHDDLMGQAVGEETGGQNAIVAVGEHRAGEGDGVIEGESDRLQGVAGGEDGLASIDHEQIAGRPPPSHGVEVGGRDLAVEQDRAIEVGGDELGHVCTPRNSGGRVNGP